MSEVSLPWPPSELSPNSRIHWARKAKFAKGYKKACWALAKKAGLRVDWEGPVHVWLTFIPPDRRHRDHDNMIASAKYALDGVAQALGINDKRFVLHSRVQEADGLGGCVMVEIAKAGAGDTAQEPMKEAA